MKTGVVVPISTKINEFTQGPLTLDETIKIVSLLENPPEAAAVRKALRFYEVPIGLEFKWGENKTLMQILSHYDSPQDAVELQWMIDHVKGSRSLLEVGSSFGGTLKRMASVMQVGSRIVSVDMPGSDTPAFLNPLASLKDTCRKIALKGGNVELLIGNSHDQNVVDKVRTYGPYDFGFIDGDHSYEGVKADWNNYGPMCKMVGFHDIGGPVEGCARLWQELKASCRYRTEEKHGPGATKFGIGIVYRE